MLRLFADDGDDDDRQEKNPRRRGRVAGTCVERCPLQPASTVYESLFQRKMFSLSGKQVCGRSLSVASRCRTPTDSKYGNVSHAHFSAKHFTTCENGRKTTQRETRDERRDDTLVSALFTPYLS